MSRKSEKGKSVLFTMLLLATVISSLFVSPQFTPYSSASPLGTTYFLSVSPTRIQEGLDTNITVSLREASINTTYTFKVNITAQNSMSYSTNITVATNGTGVGSNLTEFWSGFANVNANTDFIGTYNVTLYNIAGNETFATASFVVGLTDKVKYVRSGNVNIRGSGYAPNETVTVNVKFGNTTVFTSNVNASQDGVVSHSWIIPENAASGVYTLTLTNATSQGTVKSPADVQDFTVENVCEIQTRNLANKPVNNVSIKVYNATSGVFLDLRQETNETGWVKFTLLAGNYTFKAFWKDVEVGVTSKNVSQNAVLSLNLQLTQMRIIVEDAAGKSLSFIDLKLETKYEVKSFRTNDTGTWEIYNLFVNMSYVVEARRHGLLLPATPIQNKTVLASWNNITIIVPKYTLFVQALDSKNVPAVGLEIAVYEWTAGTTQPVQTQPSVDGNATFFLTFGKYRIRALYDSMVLNEATLDLIEDNLNFTFYLTIFNVDVTVLVRDYFEQPIANVNVTIERKIGDKYKFAYSQFTGPDGSAKFNSIVGGDSRISVYIGGKLIALKTQFLTNQQSLVELPVLEHVAILGYPIATSLFALLSFLVVVAGVILVLARRRLAQVFRKKRKK